MTASMTVDQEHLATTASVDKERIPPKIVAVASGKGGVGKTLSSFGLGWYLARSGYRVVVVDLDFGVGNLHLSAGIGRVDRSLDSFLSGSVTTLNDLVVPMEDNQKLAIVPAAGRQSSITGFSEQAKHRLLGALPGLDADLVFLDIGAGSSQDNIDFFLGADHRLAIATADLSAMTALISFLKKALIHHVIDLIENAHPGLIKTCGEEPVRVADIFNVVKHRLGEDVARQLIGAGLRQFQPAVILNRVAEGDLAQVERVNKNLMRHLSNAATVLGTIPEDDAVTRCRRMGQNFLQRFPESSAAKALAAVTSHWQERYLFVD